MSDSIEEQSLEVSENEENLMPRETLEVRTNEKSFENYIRKRASTPSLGILRGQSESANELIYQSMQKTLKQLEMNLNDVEHDKFKAQQEECLKKYLPRNQSATALNEYHKKLDDKNHQYYMQVMEGKTKSTREEQRNRPLSGLVQESGDGCWMTSKTGYVPQNNPKPFSRLSLQKTLEEDFNGGPESYPSRPQTSKTRPSTSRLRPSSSFRNRDAQLRRDNQRSRPGSAFEQNTVIPVYPVYTLPTNTPVKKRKTSKRRPRTGKAKRRPNSIETVKGWPVTTIQAEPTKRNIVRRQKKTNLTSKLLKQKKLDLKLAGDLGVIRKDMTDRKIRKNPEMISTIPVKKKPKQKVLTRRMKQLEAQVDKMGEEQKKKLL